MDRFEAQEERDLHIRINALHAASRVHQRTASPNRSGSYSGVEYEPTAKDSAVVSSATRFENYLRTGE